MLNYGKAPTLLGQHYPDCKEFMCYVYLPIRMSGTVINEIPDRLLWATELIEQAEYDFCFQHSFRESYTYITIKSLWVTPESPGNRPGWHVDGYGSKGDVNYIWCDKNPTEFAIQDDLVIPDDDVESMVAMNNQIRPGSIITYPPHTLIRLDESVIHRVGPVRETGRRTFVKITFYQHQFNLEGNSHNYLFDYDWSMHPRNNGRNLDSKENP